MSKRSMGPRECNAAARLGMAVFICAAVLMTGGLMQSRVSASTSAAARGASLPRSAPETAVEQGKAVFENYCTKCHVDGDAPNLDGMYKNPKLPSGEPTTDENVRKKILRGGDIMPPYEDKLKKEEVDALIAYLHTL